MQGRLRKIIIASMGLMAFMPLASCGNEEIDQNKVYDTITSKCKLERSATDKDFFKDGIQEATLAEATDGDTATFQTSTGSSVVIRFYSIDTPESTGSVEKWGKSASIFTKTLLKSAHSIILEANTSPASKDSYGNRYLGYVWIQKDADSPYMNVNLQVVENGYSKNTGKSDDKYASYFKEAQNFAERSKLHLWNDDLEDPKYNDIAIETTLKDLKENPDTYYDKVEEIAKKVRVTAYIKSWRESSSGTFTFIAGQVIDGVEYTYNIYAGYNNSQVPGALKVGTLYTMTGFVQLHNEQYQISGLKYIAMSSGGDLITRVTPDYYLTFDSGIEYVARYSKSLYGDITVSDAVVEGTTLTFTGTAKNKKTKEDETFTFTCPVSEGFNASSFNGKTISTYGCVENKIVTILDYANITII